MAVVTFTTDFGTRDGFAGALKGVVLSLAPDAVLVDITHEVPARDVAAGAFTLAQAAALYPIGTIHVAVVDPGVGGPRADLVVEAAGQIFVGPDNGLVALAARGPRAAYRIENPEFMRLPVSPTFHGRDVFAPAAGMLARGCAPREAGPPVDVIVELDLGPENELAGGSGSVVHVDAFGNLVTSLTDREVPEGKWELVFADGTTVGAHGGRTFSDVTPRSLVLYPGSSGRVEVAVRDGSAEEITGAERGTQFTIWRRP